NRSAISNTPDPKPCIGFAISAFPPSAAIGRAVRQIALAPSGNVSNSFSAALIHEMGRVFRVFGCLPLHSLISPMLSYLTTTVKKIPTRAARWNEIPTELISHPSPRSPKMARIHHKRCVMAITAQPAELCQSKIGAEDKFEASKPQTETCGQFEKRSGRGHRLRPSFWRPLATGGANNGNRSRSDEKRHQHAVSAVFHP